MKRHGMVWSSSAAPRGAVQHDEEQPPATRGVARSSGEEQCGAVWSGGEEQRVTISSFLFCDGKTPLVRKTSGD